MNLKGCEIGAATVKSVVRQQRMLGNKPFAIVDGDTLTYEEADDVANSIANGLLQRGVRKGDVVVSYMHNSIDHVSAWFGCAKLGAIFAPINTALVNLDLEYTIRDAAPRAVIIDADLLANYLDVRERLTTAGVVEVVRGANDCGLTDLVQFAELKSCSTAEVDVEVLPEDPAGILYTGGSTGLPKGVIVSNMSFFPPAVRYGEMFAPEPADVHFGVGQMCHAIGSAIDVFCPMFAGITTVIPRRFSATRFWDVAREHGATIVGCLIGPLISALLNQPSRPDDRDHRVRIASSGTAQIPADRVKAFTERFGVELLEIYGQSETGALGAIGQRIGDKVAQSQGKPHGWCEVMIADEHDQRCPAGVQGQILLRPTYPHSFLLGYHGKPQKYVEACQNLWFHTGDLGHLDDAGNLFLAGRMSHYVRYRGENIAAIEVEHTVMLHPGVAECAIVGVPAELGDEDVKAYVQLEPGARVEPDEIVEFCRQRLAYFKVPRYVEFVTEMPRTATKNEIERHKLKARGIGTAWDRQREGAGAVSAKRH